MYRVLKLRLAENSCRNRGYILDGFPRTFKDAQNIFLYKPVKRDEDGEIIEEDEPELEEGEEPSFDGFLRDDSIYPHNTIVLKATDEELIERVKNLREDQIAGTHNN